MATVHNAIDVDDYPFRGDKEDFFLWLGRTNPDKGAHLAIDVARERGVPIVLAGKCTEQAEREYFDEAIAPRLGPGVEWTGEADAHRKKVLLSRARCLLFPLQWPEPFGIVMAEAMACGTPVVALDEGSVPEVVEHGVTGFVLRQSGGHGPRARSPLRHPARGMPGARRGMLSSEAMVSSYESVFVDVARG